MPALPLQLIAPQQVANATSTLYTSTNIKTRIDALTVCNTTAGAITLTIYLVPSAGAAGDSTTVIKTLSIPANTTWAGAGVVGQIMAVGDLLRAVASAATSLTIVASGTQIS